MRRITLMLTVVAIMVLMMALASPALAEGGEGLVTSTCAKAAGGAAASECQQPAPPL